jgi:hypothetical protein
VRVSGAQTVSLGEDRVVLSIPALVADITRAGVFRLSFALPAGLVVESVGGPSLSHWTEVAGADVAGGADGAGGAAGKGGRVVVLHLRGRTLGRQLFSLSFSGPGIARQKSWEAPRVVIREASRQTGELVIVPEEGVRLHVAARENATQFDPARPESPGGGEFVSGGAEAAAATRAPRGALAFRLLQRDWRLGFGIESLAPWIQCAVLQDVTVRDGQVRALVNFDFSIENAATKVLRVQLPPDAGSVRFTGALVADGVAVPGSPGLWEVRLQRRALGKVMFQATFLRPAATAAAAAGAAGAGAGGSGGASVVENIVAARPVDAGLSHGWVALRASGRLELKLGALPAALQSTDWQSVPASLRQGAPEPSAVLRMVESEFTLPVEVASHDPAKLLAVRVEKADLQSMLSGEGVMLTRVNLSVRLAEKRLLRLTLPPGATWWHGFVNDESVRVAADGGALLLPVTPNPVEGRPSVVEFYYAVSTLDGSGGGGSGGGGLAFEHRLAGPRFDVPLENITWRIHLPDGTVLARQRSGLQFVGGGGGGGAGGAGGSGDGGLSSISDYKSYNRAVLQKKGDEADKLIRLGNRLRSEGDQEKARQALALANTLSKGNSALNEDARVQFNALRTEQIEVGMNRRRNFVAASNVAVGSQGQGVVAGDSALAQQQQQQQQQALRQSQLAQSVFFGNASANYGQAELAQLRGVNTAEDNAVLRKVAERFLSQQQSTVGAMDSIRTTIPEGGAVLTFTRALQVGADSDLSVRLTLAKPASRASSWWPAVLAAGALVFAAALLAQRMLRPGAR